MSKIYEMAVSTSLTSVAIVEDDPAVRQRLSERVSSARDMLLVGMAEDLPGGLALLDGPEPDVLLVDLGLPGGCGTDLIQKAVIRWPQCDVMVVTVFGDQAHVMKAIESGATGYLLKDADSADLIDQIRALRAGGSPITPVIARQLLIRLAPPPMEHSAKTSESLLSLQESRILALAAKGYSYEEVADLIGISRHTVMTHVKRIYRKLQVHSKTEAVYEARLLGLVPD